jgi:hypothetical protein
MGNKVGRPALMPEHLRVNVSTTLPLPVKQQADLYHWKINELIADGIQHRLYCAEIQDKIQKLQAIIEEKNRTIEDLGILRSEPHENLANEQEQP